VGGGIGNAHGLGGEPDASLAADVQKQEQKLDWKTHVASSFEKRGVETILSLQ
jgi:hypothetical protein